MVLQSDPPLLFRYIPFVTKTATVKKTHLEPLKWVVRNQWVTSQYLRQSIKLSISSIKVYRKAILS